MAVNLEKLKIAQQASDLLSNVRRDIRAAAQEYSTMLAAPARWTVFFAAEKSRAQGKAIVDVLDKVAANQAVVLNALNEVSGLTAQEVGADYNQIRSAAESLRDTPADGSGIVALAATILATVPAKTRLW